MCSNLLRKSRQPVSVYDPDADKQARAVSAGATPRHSVTDVGANSDIVFLSLPGAKQVEEVCLGTNGLASMEHPPRIIVDTSTTDVDTTRAIARKLKEKSISFVDAPIARMPEAAQTGTLLFMVGANDALFKEIQPLLAHMGSDIVHCGNSGAGQTVKILNNMVLFVNVAALAEAIAIGRSAGVDPQRLMETLALGSADSTALRVAGMKSLAVDVFPNGRFSAGYAFKDISLATTLAQQGHVVPSCALNVQALLKRALDDGQGDAYYPIFSKYL